MDHPAPPDISKQKCIVAFGHSHMHAIGDALSKMKSESRATFKSSVIQLWGKYNPFVELQNDKEIYHPDMLRDIYNLVETEKPDLIASLLLGSEYFANCFPQTRRGFDIVVPNIQSSSSEGELEIIPYDLVFEIAYQTQRPFFGLLRDIQISTRIPVVSLLPPPPVADIEIIRSHFPESLHNHTRIYFNPSANLLYKSWSVSAAATRRICAEFGIDVVPPPVKALDENGFLCSKFSGDSVHANEGYSYLVIEQLAKMLYVQSPDGGLDGTSL